MGRKTLLLTALAFICLTGCSTDNGAEGRGGEPGPGPEVPPEEKYADIPDAVFSQFLVRQFDRDQDGRISLSEAEKVRSIVVTGAWGIESVEGLEYFPNLVRFEMCGDFEHTRPIKEVDVTANVLLEKLLLSRNTIDVIDVSQNPALRELDLGWNNIERIDVSSNTNLEALRLLNNALTSIDVSSSAALKELSVSGNDIAELDVSGNPALEVLDCGNTLLSALDLSALEGLKKLGIGSSKISAIDITRNASLEHLNIVSCGMQSVDLSGNPALSLLYAGLNGFTGLDLSGCASRMEGVYCAGNPSLKTIYQRSGQRVETIVKDDTAEVAVKQQ